MYLVPTGAESHYECYLSDVLHMIWGAKVKVLFHPRVKEERFVNVQSAHGIVINDPDVLDRIKQIFNTSDFQKLVKEYPVEYKDGNVKKHKIGKVYDGGWCSGQNVGCTESGQMSYKLLSTHMKKLVDLLSITTPCLHKGSDSPEAKRIMIAMSSLMYFLLGENHDVSPLQFIHNHQLCIDAITVTPSDQKSQQDDNENRTSLRTDNNLLGDHTNMSNCHISTASRSAIDVFKTADSNCCMWTVIGYTRASVTRSMMQI